MRPRTSGELLSPERLARVMGATNPQFMPRYFRQMVRENHLDKAIQFLVGVMDGTELFDTIVVKSVKGGGQVHDVIQLPAPVLGRIQAAGRLIDIGIPKMSAVTDAEGEAVTGIVALPDLELRHVQDELHIGNMRALPRGNGNDDGEELVYVIEEETIDAGMDRRQDTDVPPEPIEETVAPEVVRLVLEQQKAKGHPGRERYDPAKTKKRRRKNA